MTAAFTIGTNVSMRRVLDIIINALDVGAFDYWISPHSVSARFPDGWKLDSVDWLSREERDSFRRTRLCYFAPLVEGGALHFKECGEPGFGRDCTLDLRTVASGLNIMCRDYPRHFADLVGENDDATTADVFVQCCVLGGVVYG